MRRMEVLCPIGVSMTQTRLKDSIAAGCALVAAPNANMGKFNKTVVVLSEHHSRGTVGFVLNRPAQFGLDWVYRTRGIEFGSDRPLYEGGPINPTSLVILHSDEWTNSNTMTFGEGLAISSDSLMMDKIATGNTARNWRALTGYSGWMPNQLEREISEDRWLVVNLDKRGIFELDGEAQWLYSLDQAASAIMNRYL